MNILIGIVFKAQLLYKSSWLSENIIENTQIQ